MSQPPQGRSRIVHLALKVADLEQATRFYEQVFGFRQTGTGHARGHVSRHMTDGAFDLALMVYDSEDVPEAQEPPHVRLAPEELPRRPRSQDHVEVVELQAAIAQQVRELQNRRASSLKTMKKNGAFITLKKTGLV